MIYADPSFLFSLYALDSNSAAAIKTYESDPRRPLIFTPWQRLELRNTVRLVVHRLRRAGHTAPFQPGNVFKRIDEDLAGGHLKHHEPDWHETLRVAEELSALHTQTLGSGSVDLWHVATALLLRADTFWTFDDDQRALASAVGRFRRVPRLQLGRT